ncbi:unannotated protein [freshwater metagenome]|uniref:Unannotated protein n=1 Tax=freshwater metagenome TaxID=449393 RepID=A0A6J7RRP1_9ZZZZ|nr:hypothetical protein [Actinomycetota bacterium]MSW36097.1 hypothetical protein [Actinomycetota bacterium]MSX38682.1 hypothetical protein [Actinomycetota bacterium]
MPRNTRRISVRTATAVLALTFALMPALSGCAIGFDAATGQQKDSGNGTTADIGALQIRDLTIVMGPSGSNSATLIGTMVNTGTDADALTGVTIVSQADAKVAFTGPGVVDGALTLPAASAAKPAASSTRFGYNSDTHIDITGLNVSPSAFVQVQLTFTVAGQPTPLSVMTVLPIGIYEGIAPQA